MKKQATPGEVTRLLAEWQSGNGDALGRLVPLVYAELRCVAGRRLKAERPAHTLQPTALVHEAYLRLMGQNRAVWQNRQQFLDVAGQIMRRILVDYARARTTGKRAAILVDLGECDPAAGSVPIDEILAVDEALARLTAFDARQARVVELRYFAGMTVEETAAALGISPRAVKREWVMASAWLRGELHRTAPV